jgi:hypothetical protein
MSQVEYCGRVMPRWSAAGQPVLSPVLTAGLLVGRACVWVVPGALSASGPRRGLVFERLGGSPKAQDVPLSRLWPLDVMVPLPAQLAPGALFAKMLFSTVAVSLAPLLMPEPTLPLLRVNVTFVRVSADVPRPEL